MILNFASKLLRTQIPRYSVTFFKNAQEACSDIKDGATLLVGGFGLAGIPEHCFSALVHSKVQDLTMVSNTGGIPDWGIGLLLQGRQVKRMICSYLGDNPLFESQYLSGQLEVELTPQGTLGEKLRCAQNGIPAFYTATGVGTLVEQGNSPIKFAPNSTQILIPSKPREKRVFNGREYIMEEAIKGDFSLIKAWRGDKFGNLQYRLTARNFNEDIAGSSKVNIAEVEEIVDEIPPNQVHTQGIKIDRMFQGDNFQKRFEKLVWDNSAEPVKPREQRTKKELVRGKIVERAVKEVKNGMYINLGVGMPNLVPAYLPPGVTATLHSENGVLGVGRYPRKGEEDADLMNAGKEPITINEGASFFSSSVSFGIIRGSHLDMTMLGSLQISSTCDIANWIIPGKLVRGMGGAMDLVSSGSRVVILMEHQNKNGEHKILDRCSLPLTGKGVVDMLITEKAVFTKIDGRLVLKEVAKGLTIDDIKKCTGYSFETVQNVEEF